jgi:hypothetical protein
VSQEAWFERVRREAFDPVLGEQHLFFELDSLAAVDRADEPSDFDGTRYATFTSRQCRIGAPSASRILESPSAGLLETFAAGPTG